MYSNDSTQIRAGMVNFIGALLNASKLPPKGAKQDVSAILIEEALKLSKDENGVYDLYVLKPLLRANKFIFENHIREIDNDAKGLPKELRDQLVQKRAMYKQIIDIMDIILSALEKNIKL